MIEWILLYCEKDESFSVIPSEDVTFDPSTVSVGDTVNFLFGKDTFTGNVKNFGDADCYDKLKKERDRLRKEHSKKPKQASSFHADRPRKAFVKGQQFLKDLVKGSSSRSNDKQKKTESDGGLQDKTPTNHNEKDSGDFVSEANGFDMDQQSLAAKGDQEYMALQKQDLFGSDNSSGNNEDSSVDSMKAKKAPRPQNKPKKTKGLEKSEDDSFGSDSASGKEDDSPVYSRMKGKKAPRPQSKPKKNKGLKSSKDDLYRSDTSSVKDCSSDDSKKPAAAKWKQTLNPKGGTVFGKNIHLSSSEGPDLDDTPSAKQHRKKALKKSHLEDLKSLRFANKSAPRPKEAELPSSSRNQGTSADSRGKKNMTAQTSLDQSSSKTGGHKEFKMTKYTSDGPGLIMLIPGIYVTCDDYAAIKGADGVTLLVRTVFKAVFKLKYLQKCSLGGGQARAAGSDGDPRPGLDEQVVKLLYKYIFTRQAKKKWNPSPPLSVVKTSLRCCVERLIGAYHPTKPKIFDNSYIYQTAPSDCQ